MLSKVTDYLSGNIDKDKANSLAAKDSEVTIDAGWRGVIKAYVFEGIINVISINTNDITGIEDGAFKGCTALKELIMPNVEQVGENVFEGCTNLLKIDVKDTDMAGTIIEKIEECGLEQRIDIHIAGKFNVSIKNNCQYVFRDKVPELIKDRELCIPNYSLKNRILKVVVSNGACSDMDDIELFKSVKVEVLGNNVFENCSGLKTIYLPRLKEIGNGVFNGCLNLEKVEVDNAMVGRIKESLKKAQLPQQVYIFANNSMKDCLHTDLNATIYDKEKQYYEGSDSIEVLYLYTRIDDNLFHQLNVSKIDTGSVVSIGNNVIQSCGNLKEVYLPNVEEIGDNFCKDCPNIEKITVKDEMMADLVKDILTAYGARARAVDISIYIYGEKEPFVIIPVIEQIGED